jgi:hypothetical protein
MAPRDGLRSPALPRLRFYSLCSAGSAGFDEKRLGKD